MRRTRQWLILVHRYLGIALSLLFVMWFVSGIAMIYAGGMPRLTPRMRLERMPPLDLAKVRLTPADAAAKADLGGNPGRVVLLTILGRPAYRFGGGDTITVFADTGEVLEELGQTRSLAVALTFLATPASSVRYAGLLDEADQWTIGQRRLLPLHKIVVGDAARTELYVSEPLGEVVMQTTRGSRALAWVAAIPHWLYFAPLRLNDRLWTRVVLWTSGLGAAALVLGLALGLIQFRVKYVGWMRWHYLTGVIFGLFGLTWVFSGFLSMEPFEWFSRGSGGAGITRALVGAPLSLSEFPPFDILRWNKTLQGREVKEVEFRRVLGEPSYVVRGAGPTPLLMAAASLEIRGDSFPLDALVDRIAQGYPEAAIADARLLSDYDGYYYDRDRTAPLPVVRVKFGDAEGTWVYVEGTGQMVARFTRRQRLERWLYHGLHSLDFSFWYYNRPLWDIAVIILCGGGALLSTIGVVIGFKRLKRNVKRSMLKVGV